MRAGRCVYALEFFHSFRACLNAGALICVMNNLVVTLFSDQIPHSQRVSEAVSGRASKSPDSWPALIGT